MTGFDEGYRRWRASTAHAALIGSGYPEPVQPFSFVPFDGLESLAADLAPATGGTLLDLGCGRGGPGLWLAGRCAARLVGVDASAVAITDARARRAAFPGVTAHFAVTDVTRTGLRTGCADAAVAIDVLQLVRDPAAMLREAARLLRPGGRIVLTTWEASGGPAPARFPRDVAALATSAGLHVERITDHPAWLDRQRDIYARAAAGTAADPAVADLAAEARRWQSWIDAVRRVTVVART